MEGTTLGFAGAVKAAVACAITVGALLIAAMTQGESPPIKEAIAAIQRQDAQVEIYLPANLPAPTGAPEQRIEAF